MIGLNLTKIKVAREQIKELRSRVANTADGVYRQKLYLLMEIAVKVSPQFSGEFASNWQFSINGVMPSVIPWAEKTSPSTMMRTHDNGRVTYAAQPHQAGDEEAVNAALYRAGGKLRGVTLKDKVSLINPMPLDTDGTFMYGPDGKVHLRPENLIPGNVRIESYVEARAREVGVSK